MGRVGSCFHFSGNFHTGDEWWSGWREEQRRGAGGGDHNLCAHDAAGSPPAPTTHSLAPPSPLSNSFAVFRAFGDRLIHLFIFVAGTGTLVTLRFSYLVENLISFEISVFVVGRLFSAPHSVCIFVRVRVPFETGNFNVIGYVGHS